MNIKVWTHPTTGAVRYYFDMKFGAYRFGTSALSQALNGAWIAADEQGNARVYRKLNGAVAWAEAWVGEEFFSLAYGEMLSFAKWEAAFAACQTPKGAFSEAKWGKLDMAA